MNRKKLVRRIDFQFKIGEKKELREFLALGSGAV